MQELTPDAAFASALEALPPDLLKAPIGIAVSGGSDSLALLKLSENWAARRGARLMAMTVDHGLRPEAAREAEEVAGHCRLNGTQHRTLRLTDAQPGQSGLRRRRHEMLASELRRQGGLLLLTGHTQNDQAETFLMRARQGSGWYGLAGMRALSLSPVWPEGAGTLVARPLMGMRRDRLKDWLRGQGLSWASDPSNQNPAYERVRMRRLLEADVALFQRVCALQKRLHELRVAEDRALAGWMKEGVSLERHGFRLEGLTALPEERAGRGLGHLIQIAAGRDIMPRRDGVLRLIKHLASKEDFRGATLGGARLMFRRGQLYVFPEGSAEGDQDSAEHQQRLQALIMILGTTASEIAADAGNESFLPDLMPIF